MCKTQHTRSEIAHVPLADSLMHQFSSDGTVYPTAYSADDAALRSADFANADNFFPNEFLLKKCKVNLRTIGVRAIKSNHSPALAASTNISNELPNDGLSVRRVCDFGMKLYSIDGFRIVCYGSVWSRLRVPDGMEVRRRF